MNTLRCAVLIAACLALSACKIQIKVPEHGSVSTESGSFSCGSGETCDIDVTDVFFDEKFIAAPDEGYAFEGWAKDARHLCGGLTVPCRLSTAAFEGNDFLMTLLESENVWHLAPRFKIPNSWARKADMMTRGVGVSTCVVDGKLYAFGLGWTAGDPDRVEEYNPKTDKWTSKSTMPTPSAWATASAVDGRCYVIGGGPAGFRETITTVQEYNPQTDTWRARAPLPEGRSAAGSAAVDGKIYVVGGGGIFAFGSPGLSQVAIYDPSTNSWTAGAGMPTPRVGAAVGAIGDYVYAVGGSSDEMVNSSLVHRYDTRNDRWSRVADFPRNVDFASASVHEGFLYVIGGQHPTEVFETTAATFRYNPTNDSWSRRADMTQRRYSAGAATLNGRILVAGGRERTESQPLTIVEEYTP